MTPAQIRARIETASARLIELQNDLDAKEALLRAGRDVNGDGTFDERDGATVERVRNRTMDAQNRIDGLLQQLIRAEAEAEGTPIEEFSFEDEGHLVEADGDRRPFSQDKNAFKTQIAGWRVDVRESLARMVNSMLSDSGDPGPNFPRGDIVGLARTALSAGGHPEIATALGVANSLLNIALEAYTASLPSRPSLREMETKWRDAINNIDDSAAEAKYDELVQLFCAHHNMESGEEYLYSTYYDQWDALIDSFRAGQMLPSSNSINRAFMAHVIAEMPDDIWDMNWTAGEIKIYMEFDMDRNEFSFTSGSVDDITTEVNRGLKADPDLFGSGGVISLPTIIVFNISGSGWADGTYCELRRSSTTSGNTDFQLSPMAIGTETTLEEQGTLFQIFMNRRIYSTVTVTQVLD